jgi:transcriptional repressor NrdR
MKCPFCQKGDSQVIESRTVDDGSLIRRRRECLKCSKRFTTHEKVKEHFLWVIKKDGKREQYDREKVKRGILRAIEKRPVSLDLVDDVVEYVEREILKKETEEVPTKVIGNVILNRLKKIDRVAWLRFASVYLEFEEVKDFERAIEKVQ